MTELASVQLIQEEFAQREPLTTRLHGLVRSYPKGVGLVQEFLQNADDAGARAVRVFLDDRTYSSLRLPAPSMSELQGPALIVINDAEFSDSDWKSIQQIGASGKILDTAKTGRFGLGFNSVYNVTDFPMILSGPRVGIFDPHGETVEGASSAQPGKAWRLEGALWSQYFDLLAPFGHFGLSREATEYRGTAFRLPLRTQTQAAKSEICQQPFTLEDFYAIVEKLRDKLSDLLLFLRNVQDIDLSYIDGDGNERLLLSSRTINHKEVNDARARIRQALEMGHESLLSSLSSPSETSFVSEYNHEIDFVDTDGAQSRYTYRVVNGVFGDSTGKITDCAREMLSLSEKAVSLAGAAMRIDPPPQKGFRGRVFCSLPLPLASPLGPCHVNGFFDLQADRQGLFEDQGAGGASAVRVNWNRLLIERCCSQAAARLCTSLARRAHDVSEPIYEHWPRVPVQEKSLLDQLPRHIYRQLQNQECIVAGGNSNWHVPKDVLELPSIAGEDIRAALLSDVFRLPNPILPGFVSAGFAAAGAALAVLSPATLRVELRVSADLNCEISKAPRPCLGRFPWLIALFQFCASDGRIDDLRGLPLAVMSNGKLRAFGLSQVAPICLAGAEERAIFARKYHWFIDSSQEALGILRDSKAAGTQRFSPQRVVAVLGNLLSKPERDGWGNVKDLSGDDPSEDWLCRVFEYLTSHSSELKLDKSSVSKLTLVPDQSGNLHVMGMPSTPLLPGKEDPRPLLTAIGELGVPLVSGGEKLLKAVRAFIGAFPNLGVWRLSVRHLIDALSEIALKDPSSGGMLPRTNSVAILNYFAAPRAVAELKNSIPGWIPKLRRLRIFPTSSGQMVSLDTGGYHIPAAYDMPGFATEVGLLDCGEDQRWLPLYQVLGVPTLTRARLLTQILLPRVAELSETDAHRAFLWLRSNLHLIREEETQTSGAALLAQLGDALPIRCTDGQLRPPRRLYHPDSNSAVALLGNAIGFPDQSVYSDRFDLWLALFEEVGMVRAPRADDIVRAIDIILGLNEANEQKANRLSRIAEYIDKHWGELKASKISNEGTGSNGSSSSAFKEALSTRAWLPAITVAPHDYPAQLLASETSFFFKPSEMHQRSTLYLVGSVRPVCRIQGLRELQTDTGLHREPALEDVLTHFENTLSVVATMDGPVNERFLNIFKRTYAFLGEQFDNRQSSSFAKDPRVASIRGRFAHKPCLVDSNGRLWSPEQCFAESVTGFLGRRGRVRAESENIDKGLQVLGRRERPELSDYIVFFKEVIATSSGIPIAEEDRIQLRSGYRIAASLGDKDSFSECPVLVESGELVEAVNVVLDDAPWLSERARSAKLYFLDTELGEEVASAFGVRLLSAAVYESPQEIQPGRNPGFLVSCADLEKRLQSSQLCAGVHRLLWSVEAPARIEDLRSFFSGLHVIPASQLSTILVWSDGNAPVRGSEGPCDVVFDHPRNALVVSEDAGDVLYERVGAVLSNELRLDEHDLREASGHFVAILRVDPDAIDGHLTKLRVRALPTSSGVTMESKSDDREGFIDMTEDMSEYGNIPADADEVLRLIKDGSAEMDSPSPPSRHEGSLSAARGSRQEGSVDQDISSPSEDLDSTRIPGVVSVRRESVLGPLSSSHLSAFPESTRNGTPFHPVESKGLNRLPEPSPSPHMASETSDSPFRPAPNLIGKLRSVQSGAQQGRARTYVTPQSNAQQEEQPEHQQRRQSIDEAAVKQALQFEYEGGRKPKEMPHFNEGYDIESYLPSGDLDRFIEVKGSSGMWADLGVALSREQFRKASKEGKAFWLYVVEFALEPDRARVYAIQNPADLVEEYWFDGGWRDLAQDRSVPLAEDVLKEGSTILCDGIRRGTVKEISRSGALSLLDIEFEDGSRSRVVYSPRRIQVLQVPSDEDSRP